MSSGWAIETHGLVKRYGPTAALAGVDLAVPAGSIYALLGPNGAGKTTTIRILATLLRPDAGSARIFGADVVGDPGAVRRRLGLTGQLASLDEDLTGRENLVLLARLLGHAPAAARTRADELLDAFGLRAAAARQVKRYSGGMRRRLDIATSLIVIPDLLFLDEPTTGLDPHSRGQVWELVRTIVAGGTTVLLTTQYLDEADRLADRIAVIDAGRVVAEGTSAHLKTKVGAGTLRVRLADRAQRPQAQRLLADALGSAVDDDGEPALVRLQLSGADAQVRATAALADLADAGVAIADFAFGQPTLDEVFRSLTGGHEQQGVAA